MIKKAAVAFPEVFISTTELTRDVGRLTRLGELRKIGPKLYTPNMADEPETIVARNLWRVVGLLVPGGVVSHRTALTSRPTENRTVFVTSTYRRTLEIPGHRIRVLPGPGPLPGDMPFVESLYTASPARAFLECLSSRLVRGTESPSLPRAELEERLERIVSVSGEARANAVRDQAREIAPALEMEPAARELERLIGALLRTQKATLTAAPAIARAAGEPYDPGAVARFALLAAALREFDAPDRVDREAPGAGFENLAFFDAYFSNFIEGTEFRVDEAVDIVFHGMIPRARPADAHDVLGTYQVVANRHAMMQSATRYAHHGWGGFEAMLKRHHATIMQGRPDKRPGEFKEVANHAGDTYFVAPDLVRVTLRKGLDFLPGLGHPFARGVFMMFLISEIHPFDDGNGRIARALMNAELVSGGLRRILVPIAYRDDYVGALRRLSRSDDPSVLIEALEFAQCFTAAIDFTDIAEAETAMRSCGAFEAGRDARLRLPAGARG